MSALLSADGLHRLRLDRDVQESGPVFAYFGINPSTADAAKDDPTVKKLRGFTRVNGGSRFIVANVFSYRSAKVQVLKNVDVQDCNTWESLQHLFAIIREADVLVPMWGDVAKVSARHRGTVLALLILLEQMATLYGKPLLHFGTTDGGSPRHPLFLPYSTPLTLWHIGAHNAAK